MRGDNTSIVIKLLQMTCNDHMALLGLTAVAVAVFNFKTNRFSLMFSIYDLSGCVAIVETPPYFYGIELSG